MYVGILHYNLYMYKTHGMITGDYTLTIQLSSLHTHGAVLGPVHILRRVPLVVSLHRQLAVKSYVYHIATLQLRM